MENEPDGYLKLDIFFIDQIIVCLLKVGEIHGKTKFPLRLSKKIENLVKTFSNERTFQFRKSMVITALI